MGPTSNAGKIFSIFHALCGVMMIGSGFSILLKQVVQRELQAVELAQKKTSEFLVGSVLSDDDDTGDESEDKPNDEELLDISTKKGVEIAKAKIAGVAKVRPGLERNDRIFLSETFSSSLRSSP